MRSTKLFTSLAFTAALALAAAPAHAQQRSRGAQQRGGTQRGSGGEQRGSQQRGSDQRGGGDRRAQAAPRSEFRGSVPSRPYTVFRDSNRYGGFNVRGSVRLAPRVLDRHAFIIGGSRFYRPYYTFRPRLSLGFGLSIGYPVAYPVYETPYVYGAPYPYGNSYPYGSSYPSDPYYGTNAPYYDSQNGSTYDDNSYTNGEQPGGLSFTISPVNAAIFVDGVYVGTANEFGPDTQPLGLVSGRHHVEIRANGYQTMAFDADVVTGQVTPYQATLRR